MSELAQFNSNLWFACVGAALIAMALFTFLASRHLLKKLLAFNIMGSGVFLIMVGMAQRGGDPDPVPQALVLTGIVVAVSATALALVILRRYILAGGNILIGAGPEKSPGKSAAAADKQAAANKQGEQQ